MRIVEELVEIWPNEVCNKVREMESPSCFTVVCKQVGTGEVNQIIESLQRGIIKNIQ